MSKSLHRIYIATLVITVVLVTLYVALYGFHYYITPKHERFHHLQNEVLKPSGFYGHGFGIIGSSIIIIGVFGYMARKRMRVFMRIGVLKYWLEFHIFLCSLGPILILFHTAFKFGGIVAVSFWSMVAVVISGIIGRFIYIQIPRSIEGRELSLSEINDLKTGIEHDLHHRFKLYREIISRLRALMAQV